MKNEFQVWNENCTREIVEIVMCIVVFSANESDGLFAGELI